MEDVFKKASIVCSLIKKEVKLDNEEILRAVARIVNKAKLDNEEIIVYETLLKNKLNPSTVYRWLLVANSPEDIRLKVQSGQLSIRKALNHRNMIRKQFSTDDDKFIREVIWYVEEYIL